METMFSEFMEQPCSASKVIAAAGSAQCVSNTDKKLDMSSQIKQIKKQQQHRMQASYAMVAYDEPLGPSRPSQPRNWHGQHNTKVDQLQRQVTCLENELRQYQNPQEFIIITWVIIITFQQKRFSLNVIIYLY